MCEPPIAEVEQAEVEVQSLRLGHPINRKELAAAGKKWPEITHPDEEGTTSQAQATEENLARQVGHVPAHFGSPAYRFSIVEP
jgi:hypothetical protein